MPPMPPDPANRTAMLARVRGVYLITPDAEPSDFADVLNVVDIALAAGVGVVQYRNKRADILARRQQAAQLVALTRSHGALCIINDDAALATELDADGAHIGREDGEPLAARAILGRRLLGVSSYDDPRRARAAAAAGVDMLAFGSVFRSLTKPGAVYAPLARLTEARLAHPACRVVAIGGITVENVAIVAAAGAHAAAVIQAVFGAVDPRIAVHRMQEQFALGLELHESQRTTV